MRTFGLGCQRLLPRTSYSGRPPGNDSLSTQSPCSRHTTLKPASARCRPTIPPEAPPPTTRTSAISVRPFTIICCAVLRAEFAGRSHGSSLSARLAHNELRLKEHVLGRRAFGVPDLIEENACGTPPNLMCREADRRERRRDQRGELN